jgi:ribosomal protein S18 acetylase RimI-like enzyme
MASGVEVRALRPDDVDWLADLHNDAFADHTVPASLDAATLAAYLEETDVLPELSRVAFVHGTPASFCLAALRIPRASVRGEGTGRRFRRRGLGGLVLDEVLAAASGAGATDVVLESVATNAAALELYRGRGFRQVRRLLGWRFAGSGDGAAVQELPAAEAVERLVAWGWDDPSWQLAPQTLGRQHAFALDDSAVAVGKPRGDRFWLYGLAVDPAVRRQGVGGSLLRALPGRVGVPALVPETWEGGVAFMDAIGGQRESYSQWELARDLAGRSPARPGSDPESAP